MIKKFDQFLEESSKWGIIICLFLMLTLSLSSIVMRWFSLSFHWIDPFVRHLVFFAAFLGGSLATGRKQNIKIDLLTRYLDGRGHKVFKHKVDQFITLITLLIVMVVAKATWGFVKIELDFGSEVFFGIHSGVLVGIIPFGFLLISFRLVNRLCINMKDKHDLEEVEKGI